MKLISHRGNINYKIAEKENNPSYISNALNLNYDVEIDVWLIENIIYLGHDKPQYIIDISWLIERKSKIWIRSSRSTNFKFAKLLENNTRNITW